MDLDRIIRDIWCNKIKSDYDNDLLLLEDTLKCTFYYHLRNVLVQNQTGSQRLIVCAEFKPWKGEREAIDLAVVRLPDKKDKNTPLREQIQEVLALIELKYKCKSVSPNSLKKECKKDRQKLLKYARNHQNCLLYEGVIYERDNKKGDEVKEHLRSKKGKVTTMFGQRDDQGNLVTEIL